MRPQSKINSLESARKSTSASLALLCMFLCLATIHLSLRPNAQIDDYGHNDRMLWLHLIFEMCLHPLCCFFDVPFIDNTIASVPVFCFMARLIGCRIT